MDPGTASLVGAGAEVAGGLISTALGIDQATKQRQFQERMASTSHQREVNDLKAAGLNPILSAMGGSGASAPVGAMYTPDNPARGLANSLTQGSIGRQQNKQSEVQTNNIIEDSNLKNSQAAKTDAERTLVEKQKISQDIQNLTSLTQQKLNSALTAKAYSDLKVNPATIKLLEQNAHKALAEQSLTNARTKQMDSEAIKTVQQQQFYDPVKHPTIAKYLPWLDLYHNSAKQIKESLPKKNERR